MPLFSATARQCFDEATLPLNIPHGLSSSRCTRGVEALIASEGSALSENVQIPVEPGQETLCDVPDEPRSVADRFAECSE